MDTDSGCKVGDLRDLITGIPAPSKLELFTQPKLTEVQPLFQSRDVRKKDSKEVERQIKINKANKARILIKSKQSAAKEDYTPAPHHLPGYIPVLPKLLARTSDKPASSTGAKKA